MKIDFDKLVCQLTPTFLREKPSPGGSAAPEKSHMMKWLDTLLAPLKTLHTSFENERDNDLLFGRTDPTVAGLEYMLNYIYNPYGLSPEGYARRLQVITNGSLTGLSIYLGGITGHGDEHRPVYLDTPSGGPYLSTLAEMTELRADYRVVVHEDNYTGDPLRGPGGVVQVPARMDSLLREYALPDKTYELQIQ